MEQFIPKVRFFVVSDIHYQDEHTIQRDYFEKSIKTAYEYAENAPNYKKLDALFVVGDLANTGTEIQMQAFHDSLEKCIKPGTDVTLSIAKHEYTSEGEAAAHEKFARIFKMKPDVHKVINDFHFISLSTTNGDRFDDDKRAFAKVALQVAIKEEPKKPIFFFQHPHNRDTVYGSLAWANDDLTTVLMNYPQVISFSGHSHAPINDPRSIHQRHFTSVGTGTMFYFELDEFDKVYGTIPPNKDSSASYREGAAGMLIVEADEKGQVRILPYDLITDQFFPESWFIGEAWNPATFTYTDARYKTAIKPYFTAENKIDITEITENLIAFTFDQASIDKEYVNSYDITITRASDGMVIRKISIWSEYYYMNMPAQLSQKIDGLDSQEKYILTIIANSFWKTSSDTSLNVHFETL